MTQKTYKFTQAGGGQITKTLAKPTNENIEKFLKELGKKNFRELLTPDGQTEFGLFILDLALNKDQLVRILDICLVEGSDGIDFPRDMRECDAVILDFFDQRGKTLLERRTM
jgi:hypothetical protein